MSAYCGVKWNTQNGSIQLYPKGGSATPLAVLINSSTGLVGLPSKTENGILVRSLLNHRLVPGGKFKLETKDGAKTGSGTYTIVSVKHVGDTQEGDFYTEAEGEVNG